VHDGSQRRRQHRGTGRRTSSGTQAHGGFLLAGRAGSGVSPMERTRPDRVTTTRPVTDDGTISTISAASPPGCVRWLTVSSPAPEHSIERDACRARVPVGQSHRTVSSAPRGLVAQVDRTPRASGAGGRRPASGRTHERGGGVLVAGAGPVLRRPGPDAARAAAERSGCRRSSCSWHSRSPSGRTAWVGHDRPVDRPRPRPPPRPRRSRRPRGGGGRHLARVVGRRAEPLAEDRGFEPLRAVNPTRFPSERHRPLGESSAEEATGAGAASRNRSRPL
jgi:hypothetical protein